MDASGFVQVAFEGSIGKDPSDALLAVDGILDGAWAEAASRFYDERQAKIRAGKSAPKGVQRFLNDELHHRFEAAGWAWHGGRATNDATWIRITFRHQMSLGSDFWEASKALRIHGFQEAAILAADNAFLRVITPNDATALCSWEKLLAEFEGSTSALPSGFFIGQLTPSSRAEPHIEAALNYKPRPRDRGVPTDLV